MTVQRLGEPALAGQKPAATRSGFIRTNKHGRGGVG